MVSPEEALQRRAQRLGVSTEDLMSQTLPPQLRQAAAAPARQGRGRACRRGRRSSPAGARASSRGSARRVRPPSRRRCSPPHPAARAHRAAHLIAQAEDLARAESGRQGLYLSATDRDALAANPKAAEALAGVFERLGITAEHGVEDFDGRGGLLIVPDQRERAHLQGLRDTYRDTGGWPDEDLQRILGRLTAAGAGKRAGRAATGPRPTFGARIPEAAGTMTGAGTGKPGEIEGSRLTIKGARAADVNMAAESDAMREGARASPRRGLQPRQGVERPGRDRRRPSSTPSRHTRSWTRYRP